jgi:cell division septal protein FtsQ
MALATAKAGRELFAQLGASALLRSPWRAAAAAGACALLAAGAVAARHVASRAVHHPRLAVGEVVVEGARRAAPAEIAALAGVRAGDPWLTIDAAAARRRIRTHPWVEDVSIERPWIGRVKIVVREEIPVARLEWGGRTHGLAKDLTILPPAPADSASSLVSALPSIEGVAPRARQKLNVGVLERAQVYVAAIRRERELTRQSVRLTMDASGRDVISVREKGLEVVLEEPIAPEVAVQNLVSFLETLDAPGECRGTLHVYSAATAVWKASGSGAGSGGEDG